MINCCSFTEGKGNTFRESEKKNFAKVTNFYFPFRVHIIRTIVSSNKNINRNLAMKPILFLKFFEKHRNSDNI